MAAPRGRRTQRAPLRQYQHGRNPAEIRFHLKFNKDEISAFSDRRRDLKTLILAAAGFSGALAQNQRARCSRGRTLL
jgi:hypothetical protein